MQLGRWLRSELRRRELSQAAAAGYSGVAVATINETINKWHVPRVSTLFRLADYFEVPREETLRLAGHLSAGPAGLEAARGSDPEDDFLIRELVEEIRKVQDAWKGRFAQVAMFARLANRPPYRIIGEDEGEDHRESATTDG